MRQADDELSRSRHAARQRGNVSIADAVTAAAILGATDHADLATIGQVLDLTALATPAGPTQEPVPVPPPSQSLPSMMPSAQATTASRPTITGTPVAAWIRREDHAEPIPAWLDAVRALPPTGSGSFGVRPEPPIPAVQARSSMATLAATWRTGRQLDMAAMVRRSALLQPLTASFLAELQTAPFVQLLLDRGEGMQPYLADLDFLADEFVDVAGRDRVERRTFVGTPLRGLDPDFFTGESAHWEGPAAGSLVLVLTDLGLGGPPASRDRAPASEWRAMAATVASVQADLRVLTPFPPARSPAGLAEIIRIVNWDSLAQLVRLRG